MKTRDGFIRKKEAEEAKNQSASSKADQKLVKAVVKKEGVIGKKTAKQQAHQKKAVDRVTKEQNKRGSGR